MNFITHASFGMLATFLLYTHLQPAISQQNLNYLLIAAAIGSLLPDIDHPKAYVSKKHWMMHAGSHLIEAVAHHRGITHSLAALLAITGMAYYGLSHAGMDAALAAPFALGYFSHLLADSLNPSGVRWLQPVLQNSYKLNPSFSFIKLHITTGSLTEKILAIALGLTFIYLYLNKIGKPLMP
jgi:inner membrane protein